ncbi:hypothetical protein BDV3_001337 [Batrachochytrium dendrobatidis]
MHLEESTVETSAPAVAINTVVSAGDTLLHTTHPLDSSAFSTQHNTLHHSYGLPAKVDFGFPDRNLARMDSSIVISTSECSKVRSESIASDASRSAMSINGLCDSLSYTTDEDVQLAVEALGGLRNANSHSRPLGTAPAQTQPSGHDQAYYHNQHQGRNVETLSYDFKQQASLSSVSQPSVALETVESIDPHHHHAFFSRVSNILPLVNSSISTLSTVYEATKNSSSVVKYSAESVESGVKTITKPVFDTLEPALTPLDRFACNQLDKLERSVPYIFGSHTKDQPLPDKNEHVSKTTHSSFTPANVQPVPPFKLAPVSTMHLSPSPRSAPYSTSSSSRHSDLGFSPASLSLRSNSSEKPSSPSLRVERKPRSRLHQVVVGMGVSMGVFSNDTLRVLKYCLHYLQHAIQNIERQMAILTHHLIHSGGSLSHLVVGHEGSWSATPDAVVTTRGGNLLALLESVKREIVETVRTVVGMVSRHAAMYLPGDARQTIRSFILDLPSRLASLTRSTPPNNLSELSGEEVEVQEAQRVLKLASESSAMLKGIEQIFSRTAGIAERMLEPSGSTDAGSVPMSATSSTGSAHGHYSTSNGSNTAAVRRKRLCTTTKVSGSDEDGGDVGSPMMDVGDNQYMTTSTEQSSNSMASSMDINTDRMDVDSAQHH